MKKEIPQRTEKISDQEFRKLPKSVQNYITELEITCTQIKRPNQALKTNIEAYHKKKKEIRIKKVELEDLLQKPDEKWIPHSQNEPQSHKKGKPLGGKGKGRKLPEKIHYTLNLYPNYCPNCDRDIVIDNFHRDHYHSISEIIQEDDELKCALITRLVNVRYTIFAGLCPYCHRTIRAEQGALKGAKIGIKFITYVIQKRLITREPYAIIIKDLIIQFGAEASLSAPTICKWFKKFEKPLDMMEKQLRSIINEAPWLNTDETGVPMDGANHWLWVLTSKFACLFLYHSSRGHEAIKEILKEFDGIIISDFWKAYDKLDQEKQKCMAHLLSDIIELMVSLKKSVDQMTRSLQESIQGQMLLQNPPPITKRGRKKKLTIISSENQMKLGAEIQLNTEYLNLLRQLKDFLKNVFTDSDIGWKTPLSKKISSKAAETRFLKLIEEIQQQMNVLSRPCKELVTLIKRCIKYSDQLFIYLDHEQMPADNNQAERCLRHFAVQRKISGNFKSPEVIRHYALYLSLFMTCQLNHIEFGTLLGRILMGEQIELRSELSLSP